MYTIFNSMYTIFKLIYAVFSEKLRFISWSIITLSVAARRQQTTASTWSAVTLNSRRCIICVSTDYVYLVHD